MTAIEFRRLSHTDVPGGGQVTVKDGLCFIGHIEPPAGTTILDVSDPSTPRVSAHLEAPAHMHSHKVRVVDDVMLVNNEAYGSNVPADVIGGFRLFNISDPSRPREILSYATGGKGVHRFDLDGRYAYLSTEMKGFAGSIVLIVDLADPSRPREISRWWLPGQWTEGDEPPLDAGERVHHPLRFGDKLYVSCCRAGMALVDISDLSKPKTVARHPLHGRFTHTVLPHKGKAGDFIVAVDEGWWDLDGGVTVLAAPEPSSLKIVAAHDISPGPQKRVWAAHQPFENMVGDLLFVAWFGHGLRVLDLSIPSSPKEVGCFLPEERSEFGVMSNDVFVDADKGLVYLVDRMKGLDILGFRA